MSEIKNTNTVILSTNAGEKLTPVNFNTTK